ncbi:MAG: 1-acylglycerol-3-phosphate O-acyltransferase [Bdellovibrionales bacterium]|nr:1-acylglycerol-3-phosphate O-acyltransferase [Bdellovibrionales bacterium]
MSSVQLALRSLGFFFWIMIVSILGILVLPFRWGDRNLDRDYARVFSWLALKIASVRVFIQKDGKALSRAEVAQTLEAHQPCVYVANHQSGLDMAIFGSLCPSRTVVTGKKELMYIPFFGLFYVGAGNILLNRQKSSSAIAALKDAAGRMQKENLSVWMFPEGTRNKEGRGLLPFKKGPFHLAIAGQVPIVPIIASSLAEVANWQSKGFSGGDVRMEIMAPIPTQGMTEADVLKLSDRVRAQMLAALDRVNQWKPDGKPYAQ